MHEEHASMEMSVMRTGQMQNTYVGVRISWKNEFQPIYRLAYAIRDIDCNRCEFGDGPVDLTGPRRLGLRSRSCYQHQIC